MTAMEQERDVISLDAPSLTGNERRYLNECIDTNWISWQGAFGARLERSIGDYCGTRHGLAIVNGTQALVLALQALDIGSGDQVMVPTLNFSASAFAATAVGADIVWLDSEQGRFTLDPRDVAAKLTRRTRAVIAVHLYGWTVDMAGLLAVTAPRNVAVIEDVAEAFGATVGGRRVGSLGTIACHSFHNKIIASGEGGAITLDDDALCASLRELRTAPPDNAGATRLVLNNRMSNLAAAVALAQLERIEDLVARRRRVAAQYDEMFRGAPGLRTFGERRGERAAYWRYQLFLTPEYPLGNTELAARLRERRIEARPVFTLVHAHPLYKGMTSEAFPNSTELSAASIDLPSGPTLTPAHVSRVAESVLELGRRR